jgi:hypothetical protein
LWDIGLLSSAIIVLFSFAACGGGGLGIKGVPETAPITAFSFFPVPVHAEFCLSVASAHFRF